MKKMILFSLALVLCFSLPLMAQEKAMDNKQEMAMPGPPPPLDDDFLTWMVGEWKGTSESAMGKSEDWLKCEMAFGGQYLTMQYKSSGPMGKYEGGGAFTIDQDGSIAALWIDSFRDMSKGKGKREGNVMTMHWQGKMGKGSRVTEKVGDDKFKVSAKFEMPDGSTMESTSVFTRVKAMADKKQ